MKNNNNSDNVKKLDSHDPIEVTVSAGTTASPHYTFEIAEGGEFTAGLSYKFSDGDNSYTTTHPLNIGTGESAEGFVPFTVTDGTMPLQADGSFTITIPEDATTISYKCNSHPSMFGTLNVVQTTSENTTTDDSTTTEDEETTTTDDSTTTEDEETTTTTDDSSTAPDSITMSLPDEIVVDQDNPNAGDFIYVSGRCYEKTSTSGEEHTVTHDQVFGGMLNTKQVTVHSPKNSPKDVSETRTDVLQSKFTDCNDCGSYGERYRGQKKETGKDFKIKVIHEIDTDAGQAFRYKLNGEDRNGFFNLSIKLDGQKYRDLVFFDNDSVVFDIQSLNDDKSKFKLSNGLGATLSADGNKLTIGTSRSDPGLYSNPRNTTSSITPGTYSYSENNDDSVGGSITILSSLYETNSQYDEEKLKQFPERLLATYNHSLLIKNDGRVYGAGDNQYYSLGIDRSRPNSSRRQTIDYWESTRLNEIGPIKKISGCGHHHCYITYDNKLYLAGRNDRGQLGRGTTSDNPTPAMAMIRNSENEPINLSEDIHTRIVDADAGYYHTVALDVNQRIWVWGTSGMHGSMMLSFNNARGGNNGVNNDSPSPYNSRHICFNILRIFKRRSC